MGEPVEEEWQGEVDLRPWKNKAKLTVSNEIRTLVDHVVNHGATLREAGQRVQPDLSRYGATVNWTYRQEHR